MSTTEGTTMTPVEVKVDANSGNVRPWQARVYVDGVYVGRTGFYKSEERARSAGRALAQKHLSKR